MLSASELRRKPSKASNAAIDRRPEKAAAVADVAAVAAVAAATAGVIAGAGGLMYGQTGAEEKLEKLDKLSKISGTCVTELQTVQQLQLDLPNERTRAVIGAAHYTSPTRSNVSPTSGTDSAFFNFRSQYTVSGLSFLVLLLNKHIRGEEEEQRMKSYSSTDWNKVPRIHQCAGMSKSEFVSQCLSIGEPQELLAEALAAIYESLLTSPLAVPLRMSSEPASNELDVEFRTQEAFGIKLRKDPETHECLISALLDFGQAEREAFEMEEGQTLLGVCGQSIEGA
jgi:hypothetical protein